MYRVFLFLTLVTGLPTRLEVSGFMNGLRISMSTPSPCLSGFDEVAYLCDTFAVNDTFTTNLHIFRSVVNELTETVQICQMEPLANQIYDTFIPANMNAMTNYVLLNIGTFMPLCNGYMNASANHDPYLEGWYAGKIFSLLFNYKI